MANGNGSLCMIGLEKSQTNIELLNEAKKAFDSVFFVPIEAIGVGISPSFSIQYRVTDLLKFSAVLPRIPKRISSYGYQLLSLFPSTTYMPIKPIAFLLAEERFFLLTILRKRQIPTIDLQMTKSPKAAIRMLDESRFPVVIRTPNRKTGVIVDNISEAKSVIEALGSLKQSVLIEEPVKNMVSVYVARPGIIAAVKKKTKEKDVVFAEGEKKKQKIDKTVQQLALDACSAIDSQIARIDISLDDEPSVVNIELNPSLTGAGQAVGENLPRLVIDSIKENYVRHQQKPVLMKFFEDAKSVVKDVLKTDQM